MRIFLEALEGTQVEQHEVSVKNMLWLKLELSSGQILEMNEETGPIEEGNSLWVRCTTGRLRVSPDAANAITIKAEDY